MPLLAAKPVFAASASMSLSPGASSVAKGSIFTVSVYENSGGDSVNAAVANLAYPADKLDYVGIGSSAAFSIVAASSGGGGSVQIDRGALPAVSGKQLVATVRFKAKVDSGTASVTFSSGKVVSADSNADIYSGGAGGTYTLKAVVASPAAPPPPPADTTPPTIKDIKVSDVTYKSTTISWVTSEPATSQVDYGINNGYGLTKGDNNLVTDHKMILDSPLITPGTNYHFAVKSVDGAGNAVTGKDQTFTSVGAVLAVTVVDQKQKPVSEAKISLQNSNGITNKQGKATIGGLQLGKTIGVVTYKGKQTAFNVEVKPIDPKGAPQVLSISIKKPSSHLWLIILPLIALLLLVGAMLAKRNGKGWSKFLPALPASLKPGNKNFFKINKPAEPTSSVPAPTSEPNVIKPSIPPKQ